MQLTEDRNYVEENYNLGGVYAMIFTDDRGIYFFLPLAVRPEVKKIYPEVRGV